MNSVFIPVFSVVLAISLLSSAQLDAQIGADEASREYMAAMCAHSAGVSRDHYRNYGSRLALTLSMLGAEQQRRVFGYLPIPGAALRMANGEDRVMAAVAVQTEATSAQLSSAQLSSEQLSSGQLSSGQLSSEQLSSEQLSSGQLSSGQLSSGQLSSAQLSSGQLSSGQLSSGQLSSEEPGALDDVINFFVRLQSPKPESAAVIMEAVSATEENTSEIAIAPLAGGGASSDPSAVDEGKKDSSSDDDGNNGHGNSGGYDPSNPGKGKKDSSSDDDGNNGHGNSGGYDPSNPGKGKR